MKLIVLSITIILSVILLVHCTGNRQKDINALNLVKEHVLFTNTLFDNQLRTLSSQIAKDATDEQIQKAFEELRRIYKQMEWAVAYFMPETARFTNGPALDEIEFEEHTVLEAEGLQVLEEWIYPLVDTTQVGEMQRMIKKLSNKSLAIDTYFQANNISMPQLMDALRSQLFRIATLGITGFDTPVSGTGLKEAGWSLNGVADILYRCRTTFKNGALIDTIFNHIAAARQQLDSVTDRNSFNYLDFINKHLNVISTDLHQLRLAEQVPAIEVTQALQNDAPTLFTKGAFHPDAFVPGANYKQSVDKVALGKILFSSPMLSGNGNRSCTSCHQSKLAFTDGSKTAAAIQGIALLRNTPSLNYANFQHGQFWDMRRADLETQAEDVITNKDEMHGSLVQIVKKLNADEAFVQKFKSIYKTDTIVSWQLQNVLSAYIRSLSAFSSGFDKYMQGNKMAMNSVQQRGFNLFVGKGKCATCHFIPLFNGTVPPEFSKTESEVLGVATDFTNKHLDTDPGRGRFHETVAQLQHSFKTPSLRNVAKTAPYMHNGGYPTLQQVMEFYNEGGGQGFGFDVENQTLPADKLNLTQDEIDAIISFMEALTDEPL